ncbi:MAG: hypothetical protein ACRC8M_08605 [Cetobacterium sp.]|uniref:hypothetical protein n=1 Tax=Cetobacterium sp. TaxID=2071632 RepID=UPI003F409F0A
MKKVYFAIFFVLNFLGALASTGTSVDVSTTLRLVNTTNMECSKIIDSDKNVKFKVSGLESDKVVVSIKESEDGKIQLSDLSGEKILVDLNSKITYNNEKVVGDIALGNTEKDLKGKMTIRVMYN